MVYHKFEKYLKRRSFIMMYLNVPNNFCITIFISNTFYEYQNKMWFLFSWKYCLFAFDLIYDICGQKKRITNYNYFCRSGFRCFSVLAPLFGFTWTLGFFSINEDTIVLSYLFVIINSFQVNAFINSYCDNLIIKVIQKTKEKKCYKVKLE